MVITTKLTLMDFTNYDAIFSDFDETQHNPFINKNTKSSIRVDENFDSMEERMNLAKSNEDLIDMCIATKSDSYLSRKELLSYGVLALNTAAIDAVEGDNFRVFARRRIELTLVKAIAEADLIAELVGKVCDKDKLGLEFASLEKTYCYN